MNITISPEQLRSAISRVPPWSNSLRAMEITFTPGCFAARSGVPSVDSESTITISSGGQV